ncbi:hypothetical protein ACFXPA_05735 [Amycolatopsis sp. NPDC059090]|uniref:hypothetical protein n=1 Tax=Amycolatopsis sp. NPDC059090 TaxID=3346723 RepID=UPI00366AEEC1
MIGRILCSAVCAVGAAYLVNLASDRNSVGTVAAGLGVAAVLTAIQLAQSGVAGGSQKVRIRPDGDGGGSRIWMTMGVFLGTTGIALFWVSNDRWYSIPAAVGMLLVAVFCVGISVNSWWTFYCWAEFAPAYLEISFRENRHTEREHLTIPWAHLANIWSEDSGGLWVKANADAPEFNWKGESSSINGTPGRVQMLDNWNFRDPVRIRRAINTYAGELHRRA